MPIAQNGGTIWVQPPTQPGPVLIDGELHRLGGFAVCLIREHDSQGKSSHRPEKGCNDHYIERGWRALCELAAEEKNPKEILKEILRGFRGWALWVRMAALLGRLGVWLCGDPSASWLFPVGQ